MRVVYHCYVLVWLFLHIIVILCKQEDQLFSEEDSGEDNYLGATAAEQYIDFISGGSKLSDDLIDEDNTEGSRESEGNVDDQALSNDEDYGSETLTSLLSMTYY